MESWQWIFGFFVILMIARIVPRLIRQRKMNFQRSNIVTADQSFNNEPNAQPFVKETKFQPFVKETKEQPFETGTKPESKEMMVLGQINRGYKTFAEIRKKTGFDSEDLNSILDDLEKRGLMRVQKKNGLLGIKVELLPTEKGYLEYDS
jgi:predicted HTH transcriptional regulator